MFIFFKKIQPICFLSLTYCVFQKNDMNLPCIEHEHSMKVHFCNVNLSTLILHHTVRNLCMYEHKTYMPSFFPYLWLLVFSCECICDMNVPQRIDFGNLVCTCPICKFGIFKQWFLVLIQSRKGWVNFKWAHYFDLRVFYLVGKGMVRREFKPKSRYPKFKDQVRSGNKTLLGSTGELIFRVY